MFVRSPSRVRSNRRLDVEGIGMVCGFGGRLLMSLLSLEEIGKT